MNVRKICSDRVTPDVPLGQLSDCGRARLALIGRAGGVLRVVVRSGKRPASVHVTKIVNNQKMQQRLCQECARTKWEDMGFFVQPHLTMQSLLSGLLSSAGGAQIGSSCNPG